MKKLKGANEPNCNTSGWSFVFTYFANILRDNPLCNPIRAIMQRAMLAKHFNRNVESRSILKT